MLELMATAAFGKQKPKQNIILLNSTFYSLSFDIYSHVVCGGFLENNACTNFFLKGTPEGLK